MNRNLVLRMAIINALFVFALQAQWSVSADFTAMYDDNVNNNSLQLKDRIGQFTLTTGYDWDTEMNATQALYSGNLTYFTSILDRTSHYHTFGLTQTRLLTDESQASLNVGATCNLRVNREYYSFYDHNQFTLYGNVNFGLTDAASGRTGYTFRSVAFSELSDFNYTEHYGFGQVSASLPTKTSVILEGDLGIKVYKSANVDTTTSAAITGQHNSIVTSSVPIVTQLVGLIRIGQSINDKTGLSLTATYQVNIQKETRYLVSSSGIISDDEIFDDHYAYEGPQGSIMISHLLGENVMVRASAGVHSKLYSNRPAFDILGNEITAQRKDTRRYVTLLAQGYVDALGVTISAHYDYIVNSSNDQFYDYRNNALAVSLSLPL